MKNVLKVVKYAIMVMSVVINKQIIFLIYKKNINIIYTYYKIMLIIKKYQFKKKNLALFGKIIGI